MPAQRRVGFDVGDSSSEEDGENPNELRDDGIPAASQWPLGSIPGSQGYMIVWAQTHPGAIIHLCYTIAITLSKI